MNKMRLPSVVRILPGVVIAAALLAPVARAADKPLVGDTYLTAASPATNFGGAPTLNVAPNSPALVQFDLSSIPAGTNVSVAYLRVFVNKVTTPGALTVSAVTSAWVENTVTSASQPTVGPDIGFSPADTANAFLVVDVTALVQQWLASPATNFGIQISSQSVASVSLDSKENGQTSHPAQLEVSIIAPTGAAGPPGPAGAAGATGPAGPAGTEGAAGPIGPNGPSGPAGPKGIAGLPGDAGSAGPLGASGLTGPTGPAGIAGVKGAMGAAGVAGPQGPAGPTGPAGPIGITGSAGASGIAGVSGSFGPAGPAGDQGPVGALGPKGPTGNQGSTGSVGPAGNAGTPGATGTLGATGAQGSQGADGPAGNVFNFATSALGNNSTIGETDSNIYYLADNSGGAVSVNLPHSIVAGRLLVIHVKLYFTSNNTGAQVGTNQLTVKSQSGDSITAPGQPGVTSLTLNRSISLSSDGQGRWAVVGSN